LLLEFPIMRYFHTLTPSNKLLPAWAQGLRCSKDVLAMESLTISMEIYSSAYMNVSYECFREVSTHKRSFQAAAPAG
jgi:hypothetical protein